MNHQSDFEFENKRFIATDLPDGTVEIMDSKGCTIKYDSVEAFLCDARAEGGADQVSGWEY